MHIVADEWIMEHTVKVKDGKKTAINASQAKILGLEWHELTKGWKKRVIGLRISNASKALFELLCCKKGKKAQETVIKEFKATLNRSDATLTHK